MKSLILTNINNHKIIDSVLVNSIQENFIHWLESNGVSNDISKYIYIVISLVGIMLLAFLAGIITKQIIIKFLNKVVTQSKAKWDDILLRKKTLIRLSHIIPAIIIYILMSLVLNEFPKAVNLIHSLVKIYLSVIIILSLDSLINSLYELYNSLEASKGKSIKSYVQILKIIIYLTGSIIIISIALNKEIGSIFAGIGALTAVIMLVFKDSILGLVGGIQLSTNDLVKVGDWIQMTDRNIDGDVIEISLNTVKVQNWDKTIATVPTYALVSESFINWRGMQNSGGRRIKRSLLIDMKSIKFCTNEMILKYKKIKCLKEYIEKKNHELSQYNKDNNIDNDVLVNGRRLTNIGTFRKYLEFYLKANNQINSKMTFLVRQLQSNERGLPIEIYVFTNTINWSEYEEIQSNIFDHILAVVSEFDLSLFQNPSVNDFQRLLK